MVYVPPRMPAMKTLAGMPVPSEPCVRPRVATGGSVLAPGFFDPPAHRCDQVDPVAATARFDATGEVGSAARPRQCRTRSYG